MAEETVETVQRSFPDPGHRAEARLNEIAPRLIAGSSFHRLSTAEGSDLIIIQIGAGEIAPREVGGSSFHTFSLALEAHTTPCCREAAVLLELFEPTDALTR